MIVSWIGRLSTFILLSLSVNPCWASPEVIINDIRDNRNTIKLRLSATDEGELIPNLEAKDLEVISNGKPVPIKSLTPPKDTRPAPARLVILLDMSNSMMSNDSSGQTRQEGAIQAIRTILAQFKNAPVKFNIVPFGQGGEKCKDEDFVPNPVSSYLKEDNFLSPNSDAIEKELQRLAQKTLCASTNLYDPLEETINYLQEEEIRINQQKEENTLSTRFGIILLSDGFHSYPPRKCGRDYEPKRFEQLKKTIVNKAVPKIRIHTLGYGLTPQQLGEKWRLSRPANIEDVICASNIARDSRAKEFVDQERLKEIADLGRGIDSFSGDGKEITKQLEESVQAILGEYKLVAILPDAVPGKSYDLKVGLKLGSDSVESPVETIRLDEWDKHLPILILLLLTVIATAGTFFGYKMFDDWSNKLRDEI